MKELETAQRRIAELESETAALSDRIQELGKFLRNERDNTRASQAELAAIRAGGEPAAPQFWAVIAECGEGVLFSDQRDAVWTHTGRGTGSDGFGTPTIGETFRDAYGHQALEIKPLYTHPQPAAQDTERLDCLEKRGIVSVKRCRYFGDGDNKGVFEITTANYDSYEGVTLREAIDAAITAQQGEKT